MKIPYIVGWISAPSLLTFIFISRVCAERAAAADSDNSDRNNLFIYTNA
jgi:hypothetical protein